MSVANTVCYIANRMDCTISCWALVQKSNKNRWHFVESLKTLHKLSCTRFLVEGNRCAVKATATVPATEAMLFRKVTQHFLFFQCTLLIMYLQLHCHHQCAWIFMPIFLNVCFLLPYVVLRSTKQCHGPWLSCHLRCDREPPEKVQLPSKI